MGKLHSLRRAIEREPSKWHDKYGRVMAASRTGPHAYVYRWNYDTKKNEKIFVGVKSFYPYDGSFSGRYPYRNFVKKVLQELGEIES